MPRALQISGMAVPLASSAPASRSLRMICSGVWRIRFIGSPPALKGENDSHIGWTSPRGAGHPPYTSKYNPIEHRLFPHLARACQGVIFESVELVKGLMEKAKTSTGLRVTVEILDKVYQTGRKYAEGFKETMKIMFDEILPKWNYRVIPSGS